MFRELLYVSLALLLFAGILLLFQSFDSPSGSLTGFAVRDTTGQQTSPLTGNVARDLESEERLEEANRTEDQPAGASAQFQVAVRVVNP